MVDPYRLTVPEIIAKIDDRELTAEECVSSFLTRIGKIDSKINAFIMINHEAAFQRAKNIDKKVGNGERVGALRGVCIAIKDNICTKDIPTTCSSKMLEHFIPNYNAYVIDKLLEEDAIIIGKTNMDEFAMGSTTENSFFGPTKNPWNLSYVPGGSSGGSAAAVSSCESVLSLGSDTGGSVRSPASFCSIVGLKPTYGSVSRYGLIAYANSLDQIGPMARNVKDLALLFNTIIGHDSRDSTSTSTPYSDYSTFLVDDITDFRFGVPKEFFGEGVDERVSKIVWRGIYKLEALGATYEEVSLSTVKYALSAYYLIAMSEASSNLARYDGIRYGYSANSKSENWNNFVSRNRGKGFGSEVKRRIILGTYALSAGYYDKYYIKSLQVRTKIRQEFIKTFNRFDILIGPTMPIPPFKIGEKIEDPLALYMSDILTVPVNLVGCPAISIPCGFVNKLPIGMQMISPPLREDLLFKDSYSFEQNSNLKDRGPEI
jgi:aspartyl-tRNA(Asn)/glutamyl-tRNA(Gln) amidotransferase subunit A